MSQQIPPLARKLCKKIRRTAGFYRPLWQEWLFVLLTSLFCLFSFAYFDTRVITQWTIDFWDMLDMGRPIRDFYQYTNEKNYICGYDFLTILPHAVWNLPIWIAHKTKNLDVWNSAFGIGWSKLFFEILFVWICCLGAKISMLLSPSRKKAGLVALLSASSLIVYTAIFYWGQNDTIWILLATYAVYHCIKGNRWLFLIFAGCSFAMKPFFLFAFILLLLLTEKRFLYVLWKCGFAFLFMLPGKLLFLGNKAYTHNTALTEFPNNVAFGKMFSAHYFAGFWDFSPFIVGFLLLCVWAYWKSVPPAYDTATTTGSASIASATSAPPIPRERILWVLYFCFLAYANYLLWVHIDYYRSLSMIPLLPLLIVHNRHTQKLTLLLESVMWFCYTLHISINYRGIIGDYWCAWHTDEMWGLAKLFFGQRQSKYGNLGALFKDKFITNNPAAEQNTLLLNALPSVFLLCLAGLMIFLKPGLSTPNRPDIQKTPRWGLWLRFASPLFFVVSAIVLYCW